ncbi:hypothetical protein GE061_020311 [Apolygus lucorum]|uniref:Uncharacterized protein n=1 Tax=Apolygus lucorum TaxID=248454 RepID=A0A8S9WM21_APOLU|nr:hypothetical protein GE061_020311 [Apolygus lucorum]
MTENCDFCNLVLPEDEQENPIAYPEGRIIPIILSHVRPEDRIYFAHTDRPNNEIELYHLVSTVEQSHRDFDTARSSRPYSASQPNNYKYRKPPQERPSASVAFYIS